LSRARSGPALCYPLAQRGFRRSLSGVEANQLQWYLPVLMVAFVAAATAFGMIIISTLLGKKGARSKIKDTAYECGMVPIGSGAPRFSVKFYLVAMLFVLFDIEVVFLYPWAVVYRDMLATDANLIFFAMVSFLGILLVGYLYAVKKDAFDWK
jgi:NADH-quinone oxidoreductase subunit A